MLEDHKVPQGVKDSKVEVEELVPPVLQEVKVSKGLKVQVDRER